MRVEISSLPDNELHDYDNRDVVEVKVDGKLVWQVFDDDPDQSTLSRSFKDCQNVDVLMQLAYDAGARGEEMKIVKSKVPGEILWKNE